MKIAITGKLVGMTKKEATDLLISVGGTFTESVTYDTNYLVAAMLDSGQAKKARTIGVEVITQSEFEEFIELGSFPDNKTPTRPKQSFREIPWIKLPQDQQFNAEIVYHDRFGEISERKITVLAEGSLVAKSGNKTTYFMAVDHTEDRQVRTFRKDRIIDFRR